MSADNWAICPRCEAKRLATAQRTVDTARAACDKAYGKVDVGDYLALNRTLVDAEQVLGDLREKPDRMEFHTLREDYECGVWEGELSISYSGSCQKCGLTVEFRHAQAVS